jgi:hypothetical protein
LQASEEVIIANVGVEHGVAETDNLNDATHSSLPTELNEDVLSVLMPLTVSRLSTSFMVTRCALVTFAGAKMAGGQGPGRESREFEFDA